MARLEKSAYVLAIAATVAFAAACAGGYTGKDSDATADASSGWRLQFASVDWDRDGDEG